MKKTNLFLSLSVVLLSTIACDSELDLDKDLKFSKLPVEQQKQKIEENGIQLVNAMEGLFETEAMEAMTNMISLNKSDGYYDAPMQRLISDLRRGNKNAISNFDKQMRVSYVESEIWGEYSYNFETGKMDKTSNLENKLIMHFPADSVTTTNNAEITVNYKESSVMVPESEDYFPSEITFTMKVNSNVVMSASFNGSYYSDGSPEQVTQTLNIDSYSWRAEVKNTKKKASESYEFMKGKTIIIKSVAELNGRLTEEEMEIAFDNNVPEDAIENFAIFFQAMDIAIKGGTSDFKKLATDIRNLNENSNLSNQEYNNEMLRILNKHLTCIAFFVEDDRKFADVELYLEERIVEDYYYNYETGKYETETYTVYALTPRFVLSDGSKVSVEEFVQTGFDDLISLIEEMYTTTETYEPNIVPVETY
ncbi:MAG: hypothetical protein VB046_03710 [Paludibacter sp.]|nr:hypothetical protein [Paludibacter sp.]